MQIGELQFRLDKDSITSIYKNAVIWACNTYVACAVRVVSDNNVSGLTLV